MYILSSKKNHSWAKVRCEDTKPDQHYIDLSLCDKYRLFFKCCPNKHLKHMFDKGSDMMQNEFNFMELLKEQRQMKKIIKDHHTKQNNDKARLNRKKTIKIKQLIDYDDAKRAIKIDSDDVEDDPRLNENDRLQIHGGTGFGQNEMNSLSGVSYINTVNSLEFEMGDYSEKMSPNQTIQSPRLME